MSKDCFRTNDMFFYLVLNTVETAAKKVSNCFEQIKKRRFLKLSKKVSKIFFSLIIFVPEIHFIYKIFRLYKIIHFTKFFITSGLAVDCIASDSYRKLARELKVDGFDVVQNVAQDVAQKDLETSEQVKRLLECLKDEPLSVKEILENLI